jgi:hypothetical protein
MTHNILSVVPAAARTAGSLNGFEAVCSCDYRIGSSLESLAHQWGQQHADFMNAKAAKKSARR